MFVSRATGPTTTLIDACVANAEGGRLKFVNATVCCSAGWMIVIVWRRTSCFPFTSTIVFPPDRIVSKEECLVRCVAPDELQKRFQKAEQGLFEDDEAARERTNKKEKEAE